MFLSSCPPEPRAVSILPPGVLAVVAGLAFFGVALEASSALTLDHALAVAQARSHRLVAQDVAAAASREAAVAAGQRPDPLLRAGVENLPVDGPDRFSLSRDFMTMRSVGIAQELTRADKLEARSARFAREAAATEAGRELTLADLRRDTAIAWINLHFEQRRLSLLGEQRDEALLQVEAADAAYRGGRGSTAEVFAARGEAARLDDRIRQAEIQVILARTRLARWVGDASRQPLARPPAMDTLPWSESGVAEQMTRHPAVKLLARLEATARAEAQIAESNRRADWSVELRYSQRGPGFSDMISAAVSVPLQLDRKRRQDRTHASRLAVVEELRLQRAESVREQLSTVRGWLQAWSGSRDRLAHYEAVLSPLAAERIRIALASYRGGNATLSVLLEARRGQLETWLDRLTVEAEAARVWARLSYVFTASDGETFDGTSALLEGK